MHVLRRGTGSGGALAVPWALVAVLGAVAAGSSVLATRLGPPTNTILGVYVGPQDPTGVTDFSRAIGVRPGQAMDFLDGSSWSTIEWSAAVFAQDWKGSGYAMTWGVDMLPGGGYPPADGASLGAEARGAYDSTFEQVARRLVANGQSDSIIRLGWEFNGGWFPWAANGSGSAFVGAFRHVVDAMRSVPGQGFRFEWNPTDGDLGVGDLARYYPGDAYVDLIGLDVYDNAPWASILHGGFGLDWPRHSPVPIASPSPSPNGACGARTTRRSSTAWRRGWARTTSSPPASGTTNRASSVVGRTPALRLPLVPISLPTASPPALRRPDRSARPAGLPRLSARPTTRASWSSTGPVPWVLSVVATPATSERPPRGGGTWDTPSPMPGGPAPGLAWSGDLDITGTPTGAGITEVPFSVRDPAGHRVRVPVKIVIELPATRVRDPVTTVRTPLSMPMAARDLSIGSTPEEPSDPPPFHEGGRHVV